MAVSWETAQFQRLGRRPTPAAAEIGFNGNKLKCKTRPYGVRTFVGWGGRP